MRTVDEHLAAVLEIVRPLTELDLTLLDAQGCVLAEDIVAQLPVPPQDNAIVDGYAVRLDDVVTASAGHPVTLPVVGDVGSASTSAYSVQSGFSVRLAAGAPVPSGTEAVIPIAWTDGGLAQVRVDRAPRPGESIRRSGEDVAAGENVLVAGAHLGSQQMAVLATVGRARVRARPRPRVVIMAVGGDRDHDTNTAALTAAAFEAGAMAYRVGVVPDEPQALVGLLEDQLIRADVVVVCGGGPDIAQGGLRQALARLGDVVVDRVAMQPGAVQGFGTIGPDTTPIFMLPGDPVSAYISFEVFVRPALRRMSGVDTIHRPVVRATTLAALRGVPGERWYVPSNLDVRQGAYVLTPLGTVGRDHVSALAKANSLAVIPEDTGEVARGGAATVVVLERRHG
jgi:molybdopterin molybdotransferase